MPMSRKRCRAATASVACNDDSTRWPVRRPGRRFGRLDVADLADQDDIGVLAQDRPEAVREADAGQLVGLDLVDDGKTYSTGSSMVTMLRTARRARGARRTGWWSCRCRWGPAQSTMPNGERTIRSYWFVGIRGHAELGQLEQRPALVENPHDALLAPDRRDGRDPDVSSRPSTSGANWPSWARRRSTMFMPAMILTRLTRAPAMVLGR